MYAACTWCNHIFPANEALGTLPKGRRIAFDELKGRVWVVCGGCERWNLVPIELRWEIVEECAKAYRDIPTRASSGEIGIARLPAGVQLVRIGRPLPVEFAAWRYGDQFGRRRRRTFLAAAATTGGIAALATGALSIGVPLVAALPILHVGSLLSIIWKGGALAPKQPIPHPDGGAVVPYGHPRLISAPSSLGGWGLEIQYMRRLDEHGRPRGSWLERHSNGALGSLQLVGAGARLLLAHRVPRLNPTGATRTEVQRAVDVIVAANGPAALPQYLAEHRSEFSARQTFGDSGDLTGLPAEVRLALEMASHEEIERALLDGELESLSLRWREADEEATIADALLPPPTHHPSTQR